MPTPKRRKETPENRRKDSSLSPKRRKDSARKLSFRTELAKEAAAAAKETAAAVEMLEEKMNASLEARRASEANAANAALKGDMRVDSSPEHSPVKGKHSSPDHSPDHSPDYSPEEHSPHYESPSYEPESRIIDFSTRSILERHVLPDGSVAVCPDRVNVDLPETPMKDCMEISNATAFSIR